jgi:hypothetical protein
MLSLTMMLVSFCLLASFAGALPIEVTNPSPSNGATDVTPSATLAITSTVNSSNGSGMMGFMWTNISGVYTQGNWVGAFTNTTINWQMDASDYSTFYEWGVFVNDSWGNDINQSWNFTTEDAPTPALLPSQQAGAFGLIAKLIIGVVLVFIALGMVYFIVSDWMKKKNRTIQDTMEMFKLIFVGLIMLGICAILVALF